MRRRLAFFFSLALVVVLARRANADDDEWPRTPARSGFQMALRGDYAIPFGSTQSGLKQSDVFAGRATIFFFDIGYKPRPHFFVGGYFGFGVGACGDAIPAGVNGCAMATGRAGAEIIYSFLPAARLNPWIGYGIGVEWVGAQGTYAGSFFGPELGNFSAGFDVRVSHGLGIGPFVNFGVGEYTSIGLPTGGRPQTDFDKTLHEWLSFGARFTIFP
jgi:hypothetical protein